MNTTSELTIVIPAKNEAKLIPRLLTSVTNQDYSKMSSTRVLVADANSTDGTPEIVLGFRDLLNVSVIRGGMPSVGRNLGAAQADSTYSSVALIDASAYSGIEFWMWVSPSTATSVNASFLVKLIDENQIPAGGVCNVNSNGATACAGASAGISGSVITQSQSAGPLLADTGSMLTSLSGGWQHVRAPWSSFVTNPGWGGANERTVDPQALEEVNFLVAQSDPSGAAVAFDYCIYQLSFVP